MPNLTFHRIAKVPPKEETVISLAKLGPTATKVLAEAIAKAMPPPLSNQVIPMKPAIHPHLSVHSALASLASKGLKMVHADCHGGRLHSPTPSTAPATTSRQAPRN
jgi:hypothetical protein